MGVSAVPKRVTFDTLQKAHETGLFGVSKLSVKIASLFRACVQDRLTWRFDDL